MSGGIDDDEKQLRIEISRYYIEVYDRPTCPRCDDFKRWVHLKWRWIISKIDKIKNKWKSLYNK